MGGLASTYQRLALALQWGVSLSLGLLLAALAWLAIGDRAAVEPLAPALRQVVPALGRGEAWAVAYLGILVVLVLPIVQSALVWWLHRTAAPRRLGLVALSLLLVQLLAAIVASL